ncbi:hypothetical protein BD779DRAFT_817454 [Infundibulicybe gibba]|nr:hypothetical protein BD779DRAFT_817454 [Infundibulicybe gibba]
MRLLYVDGAVLVVAGHSFADTRRKLIDIMAREGGVLEWAKEHNCEFGVDKFQLFDFTKKTPVTPCQWAAFSSTALQLPPPRRFLVSSLTILRCRHIMLWHRNVAVPSPHPLVPPPPMPAPCRGFQMLSLCPQVRHYPLCVVIVGVWAQAYERGSVAVGFKRSRMVEKPRWGLLVLHWVSLSTSTSGDGGEEVAQVLLEHLSPLVKAR